MFFALSILSLGFFDINRLGGEFASWFVVFVFGFVTTVFFIELGKRLSRGISNNRNRVVFLFVALAATGVIRGLVVYETGFLLGLIPESELLYRLVSAPLFVLSAYLLSNALVTSFLSFRAEARRLSEELQRLSESRSAYESDLQLVNQQQRNRVTELLSAPMWELQKKLETVDDPGKLQDALLTMQSINNEVVRPLSHELSASIAEPPTFRAISAPGVGEPIRWPTLVKLAEVQPAWLFLGVMLVLGLNSQIAFTSVVTGTTIVAVTSVPILFFFWAEKKLFRKVELSVPLAITVSIVFGSVGSALGGSLAIALGLARSDLFLFQSVFLVLVLKTGNLIYGIFMVGWQKSLDDLVLVNTQQRAVNSRLRQQLWLGQKALAMELHGSVQATLQALALKLSRMQDVNLAEIGQVLSQVRKALSRIENQEYLAGQEFISLLDELEELWDGTASIDWNISEQARLTLETDLGLARCVFEVIRESVTNAVKHGSATEIFIDIKQSDSALQLRITNDGSVADVQRDSLGSELMDQLCLTRELREEGKLVVLRAELALSPEALQQSPA